MSKSPLPLPTVPRYKVAAVTWLAIYPGLAIFLAVLAFNFLGDGLQEALNPRRVHR